MLVLQAPFNRPPGAQYQWPDRGWQRESEFSVTLEESLLTAGSGPVARGQTLLEAEVLLNRLESIVVATVSVDPSFVMTQRNLSDPRSSSHYTICKGMRVHGVLSSKPSEWFPATVVCSKPDSYGLVYDDGTFEENIPTSRVRMLRHRMHQPEDPSAFQDFLQRHLSMGASHGALGSAAGQLQCQYAAFETGSVNRTGHIDLAEAVVETPGSCSAEVDTTGYERPPQLRVQFSSLPDKSPVSQRSCQISMYDALQRLHDTNDPHARPQAFMHRARTHQLEYKIAVVEEQHEDEVKQDQVIDIKSLPTAQAEAQLSLCLQTQRVIRVLHYLHSVFGDMSGFSEIKWANLSLTEKLEQQMEDSLTIVSEAAPKWFYVLPRMCPFMFGLLSRQTQLLSTGFGLSHAVNWVQTRAAQARRNRFSAHRVAAERTAAEAAENEDMEQMAEAAERLAEVEDEVDRDRIGQLKSDIVKLSRSNILEAAEKLMAVHASSEAVLEVQFQGEDGFGSGVTQNFYCTVAVVLQERSENHAVPMWVSDCAKTDGYLNCVSGLYPMPFCQDDTSAVFRDVCKRYRFLGRLMAKALRDGFIVPIPVSKYFLAMAFGQKPSYSWLPDKAATGGVLSAYAAVVADAVQMGESSDVIGDWEFTRQYLGQDIEMSLKDYLSAGGACWVDPVTDIALVPDGQDRELLPSALPDFVAQIMKWWFQKGVAKQLEAFNQGFQQVVSIEKLAPFSSSEMLAMLCGNNSVDWDANSLNQNLRPTANMTTTSPVFQLLVEYLLQLENAERAAFLNFVTACPRLPPGGVAALKIEVGPSSSQSKIPTSQTCVPKLYLPNYETIADFHKGFVTAFSNAEAGGFHEHLGN